MQLGEVIGHATSTVKHPTLHGWRMLIVQPLDARMRPDGVPIIAIDPLGGSRGDRVVITQRRQGGSRNDRSREQPGPLAR